jgi:hypothetical protein
MSALPPLVDSAAPENCVCACDTVISLIFLAAVWDEKTRWGKQWGKQIDGSVRNA